MHTAARPHLLEHAFSPVEDCSLSLLSLLALLLSHALPRSFSIPHHVSWFPPSSSFSRTLSLPPSSLSPSWNLWWKQAEMMEGNQNLVSRCAPFAGDTPQP